MEKTQVRILLRFFWPRRHEDVRQYYTSCPECQLRSPPPRLRAPLVPLSITEVPFERIAMDLVGLLEKMTRGHQYVLVILDCATRYPEAVPLRNTASKSSAKELVEIFTWVGLPKEILTGPRNTIHVQVNEGPVFPAPCPDPADLGLPPTNRWSGGKI